MTIEQLDEIAKFGWALAGALWPFAIIAFFLGMAAFLVATVVSDFKDYDWPPQIPPPPSDNREPR